MSDNIKLWGMLLNSPSYGLLKVLCYPKTNNSTLEIKVLKEYKYPIQFIIIANEHGLSSHFSLKTKDLTF